MAITEQPMSSFAANPVAELHRLQQAGEALLLKSDSNGDVVVISADEYQRLRAAADQWETITAVKEGLADVAAGRVRPAREVMARLAAKHNVTDAE